MHPMRLLLCAMGVLILIGFLAGRACGADSEWKKLQRAQATEFCSAVRMPPKQLVEAVNQAVQLDPSGWAPIAQWLNRIIEQYKDRGCGEA